MNFDIKQEPNSDLSAETSPSENVTSRSLILKFIRNERGEYSVLPQIKPDPFYEEILKDECFENIEQESAYTPLGDVNNNSTDHLKTEQYDIDSNEASYQDREKLNVTKRSCPYCYRKNFKEPLSFDSHLLTKHREIVGALDSIKRTIFRCLICRYQTLKRYNLARHLTTHGKTRLDLGSGKRLSKLIGRLKLTLFKSKYDCFHCPYSTNVKGSIIKHLRLHRDVTHLPFTCPGCDRAFNEKNGLDSHIIKRHQQNNSLVRLITNRVHRCQLCDYKDVNKSKVARHKNARHTKKFLKIVDK